MRLGTKQDAEAAQALAPIIGERIQAIRVSRQITQATLAEQLGCTVEALSRLERGRAVPSLGRLARIAAALDVSIQELFVSLPESTQSAAGAQFEELWGRSSKRFQNALASLVESLDEAHNSAGEDDPSTEKPARRSRVRKPNLGKTTIEEMRDRYRKGKKKKPK